MVDLGKLSPTKGRRESKSEHSITEPITLGDLRWLVAQCEGLADSSSVDVKEHKGYDSRDWDEASIKVRWDMPR